MYLQVEKFCYVNQLRLKKDSVHGLTVMYLFSYIMYTGISLTSLSTPEFVFVTDCILLTINPLELHCLPLTGKYFQKHIMHI